MQNDVGATRKVDTTTKELTYNPKYDELFAPEVKTIIFTRYSLVRNSVETTKDPKLNNEQS